MVNLILIFKQQKHLRFHVNLNTIAVLLVPAFYTISPLWAADKGMAIFGILRYLPLSLYVLTLMQYSREQLRRALSLVPLCCAWMTLSSCLLLLIPGIDAYVTVKEQLSGFMQYPNTFAAFLLAGLVLQGTKESRSKSDLMTDAILICGIILSGSQTGFILLFIALAGIVLIQKDPKVFVTLAVTGVCALALAIIASRLGWIAGADRFTSISISSNSFLLRLLYYRDALFVILKNPFGLGYMGYRALEGLFQTGIYSTTYVHNGLLQLLLDIGWIPALLLAAAFLRAMLSRQTDSSSRLLLFVMLGHCITEASNSFSPMAQRIHNGTLLELPEEYQSFLNALTE